MPATTEPIRPKVCSIAELSSWTGPTTARTPSASRNARPNTTLECPSENQNPDDKVRVPSPTSLRVVLSITAMWSASKACRTPPSRYAVSPSPTPPNTPAEPNVMCWGATPPKMSTPPQPNTWSARTTPPRVAIEITSGRSKREAINGA